VALAHAACEELELDRLFFVPAAQSPFKPSEAPAPGLERLRLLRLGLAGETRFAVDDQEIRRGGVSYTVDTLRDYAARFPAARLHYLIGADHVPQLPAWRDAPTLARLAEFIVIPRPGQPPAPLPEPFQGRYLKGIPNQVSSSIIRDRVQAGRPIGHLVPPHVAEAIRNYRLYL
jgi:nicotinate-nucleotide adenylyltransferase